MSNTKNIQTKITFYKNQNSLLEIYAGTDYFAVVNLSWNNLKPNQDIRIVGHSSNQLLVINVSDTFVALNYVSIVVENLKISYLAGSNNLVPVTTTDPSLGLQGFVFAPNDVVEFAETKITGLYLLKQF